MEKKYTSVIRNITPRPRSKRRRDQGIGGGISSTVFMGGNGDYVPITGGTVYGSLMIEETLRVKSKLYLPSSEGEGIYDAFIDSTAAVSGEVPEAGGGFDAEPIPDATIDEICKL